MALTERVHGRELAEALQLVIEYDPQPPFDSGSPTSADAGTLRLAFLIRRPSRTASPGSGMVSIKSVAVVLRGRESPGALGMRDLTIPPEREKALV